MHRAAQQLTVTTLNFSSARETIVSPDSRFPDDRFPPGGGEQAEGVKHRTEVAV